MSERQNNTIRDAQHARNVQHERRAQSGHVGHAPNARVVPAVPVTSARRSSAVNMRGNRYAGDYRYASGRPAKKKSIAQFLLPLFIAAFIICLAVVGVIVYGYWQGAKTYDDIYQQAISDPEAIEATPLDTQIDWDALYAINPETVAWIYIPGTDINYPIVRADNNEKYLKTNFEGEVNWAVSYGAIFLDCNCQSDLSSQNSYFYGHNMNNGAMFAQLAKLADEQAFNECRTVYLYTPEQNYKLESFAFLHVDADDDLVRPDVGSSVHQRAYVQTQMDRSVVRPSEGFPDADSIEQTFSFITCDNLPSNGRYVLLCQAVEKAQPR